MDAVLALSLSSMRSDTTRLEQISMNMSNMLTPGYKSSMTQVRPFGGLVQTGIAAGSVTVEHIPELQPGALQATGQSLDLALAGDGFFEVATAHGPAFTRQGNLHLDARSRLVTARGDAVMGQGGEITLGSGTVVVDAAGNITDQASGRQLGRLRIVRFDPAVRPQALGDGLWAQAPGMREVADAERDVRQGYLERSNVNSMQEMVRLMQTMRHFESVQRVVQGYDDMLGTAIRKLGEA